MQPRDRRRAFRTSLPRSTQGIEGKCDQENKGKYCLTCNSLNSTLRTALARLHVSDKGSHSVPTSQRPSFAQRAKLTDPIGGFERYGDLSPIETIAYHLFVGCRAISQMHRPTRSLSPLAHVERHGVAQFLPCNLLPTRASDLRRPLSGARSNQKHHRGSTLKIGYGSGHSSSLADHPLKCGPPSSTPKLKPNHQRRAL